MSPYRVDYDAIRKSLGRVIRSERYRRGFANQEAFGAAVGTHPNYVGSVERGERNVSLHILVRIADALDMPLSRLIALAEDLAAPER